MTTLSVSKKLCVMCAILIAMCIVTTKYLYAVPLDQPIHWRTGTLDITLASPNDGMGFLNIKHAKLGAEFLKNDIEASKAMIWKIKLTDDVSDKDAFITINNTMKAESRGAKYTENGLVLYWRGIKLPKENGSINVKVRANINKATGFTAWRINVENNSDTYGILRVVFPVIQLGKIGNTGDDDYLIYSPNEGASVQNPIGLGNNKLGTMGFGASRPHGLPYPSGRCQMQLSAYYQKEGKSSYYPSAKKGPGLYLATYDGDDYPKVFFYTPHTKQRMLSYEVGNYPNNSSQPKLNYHMPYPMIIGGFKGGWYEASKIYRKWALEQSWSRKGPLNERNDLPDWLKHTTGIIRSDVSKGDNKIEEKRVLKATKELPGPLGVQWYHWSSADKAQLEKTRRAGAFPPKNVAPVGFSNIIKKMQSNGAYVFPYINSRLWSKDAMGYERIKPKLSRNADGESSQGWGAGIMCVQLQWWANYLSAVAKQISKDYHPAGLYIDQAGEAYFGGDFGGCYDASHGHPLGVTQSLVKAEHKRMKRILNEAQKN